MVGEVAGQCVPLWLLVHAPNRYSPIGCAQSHWAGSITSMSLPQPGSAAVAPALLGWSSPVAGPALPVLDRSRAAIIIMLPVVDACE